MQITRDYCEGMIEGFGYNPLTGKIYDKYVKYERKVVEKEGAIADLLFKRVTSTAELNTVLNYRCQRESECFLVYGASFSQGESFSGI